MLTSPMSSIRNRSKDAQLSFLDEPADVEASPLAAWWLAKRDKPLLVFHNKYAQVRCYSSKAFSTACTTH